MALPFARAKPVDLTAATVLFFAGAVLLALSNYTDYGLDAPLSFRLVPLGLVCFGVAVRRVLPAWSLAVGLVGLALDIAVGFSLPVVCIFTDNLYAFTLYGPRRALRVMVPATVSVSLGIGLTSALLGSGWAGIVSSAAIAAIVLVSPVVTAIIVRQAHDRAQLEAERAEQTARLADARRNEAVLRERTRMARELHDTVANYLSAIALQSTGLQTRKNLDPETLAQSVAAIRQSSVEGLAELRRIIRLLRTADTDELVSYRLDQVPELIDRMRRTGLKVDFAVEESEYELAAEVETAVYRVIQESLTNAMKYGSGAEIQLRYLPEALVVTVENAMDAGGGEAPVPSGGAGLTGMTERVRLLGGTVRAGPSGSRWWVRAEIPVLQAHVSQALPSKGEETSDDGPAR